LQLSTPVLFRSLKLLLVRTSLRETGGKFSRPLLLRSLDLMLLASVVAGLGSVACVLDRRAGSGFSRSSFCLASRPGWCRRMILTVITARSLMRAGELDSVIQLAEEILRRKPHLVTLFAKPVNFLIRASGNLIYCSPSSRKFSQIRDPLYMVRPSTAAWM
jgi:Anaerobic c4-dicarboxylate membrane transporter